MLAITKHDLSLTVRHASILITDVPKVCLEAINLQDVDLYLAFIPLSIGSSTTCLRLEPGFFVAFLPGVDAALLDDSIHCNFSSDAA